MTFYEGDLRKQWAEMNGSVEECLIMTDFFSQLLTRYLEHHHKKFPFFPLNLLDQADEMKALVLCLNVLHFL